VSETHGREVVPSREEAPPVLVSHRIFDCGLRRYLDSHNKEGTQAVDTEYSLLEQSKVQKFGL
jgi:hypothetical protein